jgi:DMSO/TMAO reductase YedYZ molybdopterin-dependent catalytic subunit
LGLSSTLDSSWKLKLVRKSGDTLLISLDEIKVLPKTEIVFNFKCIEGWSQISHWSGVKLSDLQKNISFTRKRL